jgi:hypothetical protein
MATVEIMAGSVSGSVQATCSICPWRGQLWERITWAEVEAADHEWSHSADAVALRHQQPATPMIDSHWCAWGGKCPHAPAAEG